MYATGVLLYILFRLMAESTDEKPIQDGSPDAQKSHLTLQDDDGSLDSELDENGVEIDADAILAAEDPSFLSGLAELQKDKSIDKANLEGISGLSDAEVMLSEFGPIRRFFFRFVPGLLAGLLFQRKLRAKIRIFLLNNLNPKVLILAFGKSALKVLKHSGYFLKNLLLGMIQVIKKLSAKQKLAFLGLLILTGASAYGLRWISKKQIFSKETDPFIGSMLAVGTEAYLYNQETGLEYFYDSLRVSQNVMYLPKTVANLRRSEGSGALPMVAFEIYLEGISPEVIVEFKDREVEMRDLIQRLTEEVTFDQLDTEDGKRHFLETIRREVNLVLTTGRLRKVYFKTFVLKP
jgi:flagellar basal body-associated protein FliL